MAEETLGIEERLAKLEEKVASHKHADAGPPIANPAPLGLFAFGLTTLMLNLVNAELVEIKTTSLVLGYGMFYGGLCQVFAGLWEFRKNNTFGATAFTSYGAFWMGLAFWHLLADADIWAPKDEFKGGFAAILAVWGMFTGLLFVGTLKLNRALQAVFLTLTILFFLLAAGQYNTDVHRIAGYEGILCAFTAIYAAWAQVINEVWGKTILPLYPVK